MLTEVGFDLSDFEKLYGAEKIESGIWFGKDLKDRYSVLWLYFKLFFESKKELKRKMEYNFERLQNIFDSIPKSAVDSLTKAIEDHKRIFVYGAGRSGLMMKAFAMRLAQTGKTVYAVGEVVTPAIETGDLLILASASGTTASVCRNAQIVKEIGACIYAITAYASSPLKYASHLCAIIKAPTKDRAESSSIMGTLFEQALLLLGDLIIERMGSDVAQMRARHANLE